MVQEVPRPSFRQFCAVRSVTVRRIEENFVGLCAAETSAFATEEDEVLIKFTRESNSRARDRVFGRAASESHYEPSKALPGHGARRKNPTSGAPNA